MPKSLTFLVLILIFVAAPALLGAETPLDPLRLESDAAADPLRAQRIFEFSEEECLRSFGEQETMAEVRMALTRGDGESAMTRCRAILGRHFLCLPAWNLLATLWLSGNDAAGEDLKGGSAACDELLTLLALGRDGHLPRFRTELPRRIRTRPDWWPFYKVLPMLPEELVDFQEKAEFQRRCLAGAAAWRWASTREMLVINALVSALEAEAACRRAREESALTDGENVLSCPFGVPLKREAAGPVCPLHGK